MFLKAITCFLILFLIEKNIIYISAKEYVVSTDYANFFQAFHNCQKANMRLATITTSDDRDKINAYLGNLEYDNGYWLGATNLMDNGDYYWITTGEAVKYSDWLPGEPNKAGIENCLQWRRKNGADGWNDLNCDRKLKYVCEKNWEGKEFVTFEKKVNFLEAVLNCQKANMSLATITSCDENTRLITHLEDIGAGFETGFWLGATNIHDKSSKDYYWLKTGELATDTNWLVNQPDNYKGNENCLQIVIQNGYIGWNDGNCNDKIRYVCEKKPDTICLLPSYYTKKKSCSEGK